MSQLDWRDYVVSDAAVLGGRPVVWGTRIAAEEVLDAIDRCEDIEGVLAVYPQLTREAVLAVIQFRLAVQYARDRKHMQRRGPMAPGPG
jgi:uncharacterized protein (DUF433 family)